MKKINTLLAGLLAVLIFITAYVSFNNRYTNRSNFIMQATIDQAYEDTRMFVVEHNIYSGTSRESMISELISFADLNNMVVFIQAHTDSYEGISVYKTNQYGHFVNNYLDQVYFTNESITFDFLDPSIKTVISNSKIAAHFYDDILYIGSLDDTLENENINEMWIQKSFTDILSDLERVTDDNIYISIGAKKSDYSIESFAAAITKNLTTVSLVSDDPTVLQSLIIDDGTLNLGSEMDLMVRLVIIVSIILVTNTLILHFQRGREITIRKLFGNRDSLIYFKVFIGDILLPVLVFSFVIFACCLLVIFPIRPISMEFMNLNVGIIGLFLGFNLIGMVFIYIFNVFSNRFVALKKRGKVSEFVRWNILIKGALLLITMVPLVNVFSELKSNTVQLSLQEALYRSFQDTVKIDYTASGYFSFEETNDRISMINETLSVHNFYHVHHLDYFGEEYSNTDNVMTPFYTMTVNDLYFGKFKLIHEDGNVIQSSDY